MDHSGPRRAWGSSVVSGQTHSGSAIRDARIALGWSQARLADALNHAAGHTTLDRQYISRWERGARHPSTFWATHLERVLGRDLTDGLAVAQSEPRQPIPPDGTVDSYAAVTRLLASQRQTIEPGTLMNLVTAQRQAIAGLFERATSDSQKNQYGCLLGEISLVASRVFSALGDRAMALTHSAFARKLGDDSENPELGAVARIFESNLKSDAAGLIGNGGGIVEGLELLSEASAFERTLRPPARARLAAEQAQLYATLRMKSECQSALARAYSAAEQINTADQDGLFSDWDSSRLRVYEGTCWLLMGHSTKAQSTLHAAIEATTAKNVSVSLAAQVDLASAHIAGSDLDEGCRVLGDAFTSMSAMGNQRGIARARRARARLYRWAAEPSVRELDERITSAGVNLMEHS